MNFTQQNEGLSHDRHSQAQQKTKPLLSSAKTFTECLVQKGKFKGVGRVHIKEQKFRAQQPEQSLKIKHIQVNTSTFLKTF